MTTESTKKKVLVVEDDETMLKALNSALTNAGYIVIEERDGVTGLVAAHQAHPDLILLDILMPMMDGWEMLKDIREKDEWGKNVPVLILTNLSADEDMQMRKIAELSPSYFMMKADWRLEGIVSKVAEVLSPANSPS